MCELCTYVCTFYESTLILYVYTMYTTDDLVNKLSSVIDERKALRFMDEVCNVNS